jgi:hypothetical protein
MCLRNRTRIALVSVPLFAIIISPPSSRRCHMTQGAPVLAGMNNTATTQTVINVTGHWYGLGVVAGNFPRATQLAWCAIQAASLDPGSEAVYAIGRGRGVYAVGLDGEGVVSYSYNAHGVTGTTQSQNTAGVLGQNTGGGIGVLGKADGNAHADGTPASAAVVGDNAGEGEGVLGISVSGDGVSGRTSDLNGAGIFGENLSNSPLGAAVVGLGGAGVGLHASGARAAINLQPSATVGPPTSGFHSMGDLMVDANGDLYLCKTDATPGQWVKVA